MSAASLSAVGMVIGIVFSIVTRPPIELVAALYVLVICAALINERKEARPKTPSAAFSNLRRRPIFIFLAFVFTGSILLAASPAKTQRRTASAKKTNPIYKKIAKEAKATLGDDQASILLAVVFGDQTAVDSGTKDDFRRAGLIHLFAASGFNVTFAAGFIMLIAKFARAPKLFAASLALVSIGFYFWLVGPSPSVFRAVIMSALVYLSILFGRRGDALAGTSIAALILLTVDPWSLLDIGWELSFAALLGILLLAPKISQSIKQEIRGLTEPLAVTVGAQLAVAPLLIYYFGQVSIIALIANPVTILTVAYITGVGFVGSVLTLIWPIGGRLIIVSLALPIRLLKFTSALFASVPWASVELEPSIILALSMVAVIVFIFIYARKAKRQVGLPAIIILIFAVQIGGIWLDLGAGRQSRAITVNFLDVGEGDATLIKSSKNDVVLVDGGEEYDTLQKELRERGVKHIDLLILSHAHADHVGSLDELLDRFPVAAVIGPGFPYQSQAYRDFKQAVADHKVTFKKARAGQMYKIGEMRVKILWPKRTFLMGTGSDINNNSVVARLSYKRFRLLLPGDIQEEAISELVKRKASLNAQVLKVSHQGSFNGTNLSLLRHVRPKYAVISVGRNNPYGHPHRSTLSRLRRFVRRLGRTDKNGDVTIGFDGKHITFASER